MTELLNKRSDRINQAQKDYQAGRSNLAQATAIQL